MSKETFHSSRSTAETDQKPAGPRGTVFPRRYLHDISCWARALANNHSDSPIPLTSAQAADLARILLLPSLVGQELDLDQDLDQAIAAAITFRVEQCLRSGPAPEVERLLHLIDGALEAFRQRAQGWAERLSLVSAGAAKFAQEWPGSALLEEMHFPLLQVEGLPPGLPPIFHDDPFITPEFITGLRKKRAADLKKKRKKRMSVEEANKEAMIQAKRDPSFVYASQRVWADRTGCGVGTVPKLPFYRECCKRRPANRRKKAVHFSKALEATIGDNKAEDPLDQVVASEEALAELTAEQQADFEPSPLDDTPKVTRQKKRL